MLNDVLKYRIRYLHPKWNWRISYLKMGISPLCTQEKDLYAVNNPAIVNFSNKLDFSNINLTNEFKEEYFIYLAYTPYSIYNITNLLNYFRYKIMFNIRNKLQRNKYEKDICKEIPVNIESSGDLTKSSQYNNTNLDKFSTVRNI